MKFIKLLSISLIFISIHNIALSDIPHYLDFKYILNSSDAGKKAQNYLKNSLDKGLKNISEKEKKIVEEEKKIISQKKVISQEEYKKKSWRIKKKSFKSSKRKKHSFRESSEK